MTLKAYKHLLPYGAIFILAGLTLYFSVINPPSSGYFTTDENIISDSGVFLLYGNFIRAAEWPASINLWVAYFLIICTCIYDFFVGATHSLSTHGVLNSIDLTVYNYLNNRSAFLMQERLIQLVIIGFLYYRIFKVVRKRDCVLIPNKFRTTFFILLLSFGSVWIYAAVIRPDAIGALLIILLMLRILLPTNFCRSDYLMIGILFALVVSQRLIYLLFAPFVLGSVAYLIYKTERSFRVFFYFLTLIAFAFVAFMPHFFTNTIMVMKSFAGTVFAKSAGQNRYFFNEAIIYKIITDPVKWLYMVLLVSGIVHLLKNYVVKTVGWLFVINFLAVCVIILHATTVTESHIFIIEAGGIILGAFGIISLSMSLQKITTKISSLKIAYIITSVAFLIAVGEVVGFHQNFRGTSNFSNVLAWLDNRQKEEKIIMDFGEFDYFINKNDDCLKREIDQFNSEIFKENKVRGMYQWQSEDTTPLIAYTSTFEDESLILTQDELLLKYYPRRKPNPINAHFFLERENIVASAMGKEQAVNNFKSGGYDFLIHNELIPDLQPLRTFNEGIGRIYYVYAAETPILR